MRPFKFEGTCYHPLHIIRAYIDYLYFDLIIYISDGNKSEVRCSNEFDAEEKLAKFFKLWTEAMRADNERN